jgi:aminoglycoside 6-adenylyltransferase
VNESHVLKDLMRWAGDDSNIRVIILNGSRGDPGRIPDEFSDYDVAVLVDNPEAVLDDRWVERFGKVMVRWPLTPGDTGLPGWITQLVLYQSGLRIDFQFGSVREIQAVECAGAFHCVLVDRDQHTERIARTPVPGTWIEPPLEEDFIDRINAFWWDIPYVAKALGRGELDYARYILEADLRFEKLHLLMRWRIGIDHGPAIDVGIFGRWFKKWLQADIWSLYLETFSSADPDDQWRAMFAMCELVRVLGTEIAAHYRFEYPAETDHLVNKYLEKLHVQR